MTTTKQFRLGSISAGTLRTEDLLPKFTDTLASLSPMGTNHPCMGDSYQFQEQGFDDESEVTELLSDIEHELNNLCPPFVYFGTLEGDGSDFGFWVDWDAIAEAQEYAKLFPDEILSDFGVVPDGFIPLGTKPFILDGGGGYDAILMDMERNVLWTTV